jgi:hypothetical protein
LSITESLSSLLEGGIVSEPGDLMRGVIRTYALVLPICLILPAVFRFYVFRRPLGALATVGLCAALYVAHALLFGILGFNIASVTNPVLFAATVSYWILRWKSAHLVAEEKARKELEMMRQSNNRSTKERSPDHNAISVVTKRSEPQVNSASRLSKLSRWGRLFVVVSISWLLFATITYFLALYGDTWILGLVPSSAFSWSVDLYAAPNPVGDLPAFPVFNGIGFSIFVIAPVILLWGVGWIAVSVFRRVRVGS